MNMCKKDYGIVGNVLVIAACLASLLLPRGRVWAAPFLEPAPQAPTKALADARIAELESMLAKNSMTQAMKSVDPVRFERFHQQLVDAVENNVPQEQLNAVFDRACVDFMQTRLRHAAPKSIRQYMNFRLTLFESINDESPDTLFELVHSGQFKLSAVPQKLRAKLMANQDRFYKDMARVMILPLSEVPVRQDDSLAKERLREIEATLPTAELQDLMGGEKSTRAKYCAAFLHFYQGVLTLPDSEMVQVFRYLKMIPRDDRAAANSDKH